MKLNLKKTLYAGLAVVSVLAASGFAATTASAKSYAYISKADYFTTAPESRNVQPTGTHALYSKVGTSKGAHVVASTATMAKLRRSSVSTDYFRAYSIVTTNRGSVYYKVVSFNGRYRGWIYGGKDATKFGGGIEPAQTTETRRLPGQKTGFTIADPSKATLWTAPKNTQYRAAKVTGFKPSDTFTIIGAATKYREGSLYYQVKDDQNPSVTGWIYYAGIRAPQGNLVKITYVDEGNGDALSTHKLLFNNSVATTNLTTDPDLKEIVDNIPSGYIPVSAGTGQSPYESLKDPQGGTVAKNGASFLFYVKPDDPTKTRAIKIVPVDENNNPIALKSYDREGLDVFGSEKDYQVKVGDPINAGVIENTLRIDKLDPTLVSSSGVHYSFVSVADTPTTASDSRSTVTVHVNYRVAD
ncbi:hypothetical protein ACFP1H_09025 [Secundilactobacillus hailunensis]|uniref:S-layer protein n=1 Tax=Secundilactobacillus hailunensis TaxID=2559923 RepID=A0ABW1TAN8_9LACO|nr:hypothetical protein [Secundilactobacillus hailunensis]